MQSGDVENQGSYRLLMQGLKLLLGDDIIEAAERLPLIDEHAHENEKTEDAADTHQEAADTLPQVNESQADVADAEGELADANQTIPVLDNKSDDDPNDLERETM